MCDHDDFWDLWDDYEVCCEDHDEENCEGCYEEGYEEGYRHGRSFSHRPPPQRNDGCYIATAVYGSYDCPEVWTLRRFRDNYLKQCAAGRWFVKAYYAISPKLVSQFGNSRFFRCPIKKLLTKFVSRLNQYGYSNVPYSDDRRTKDSD